MHSAAECRKTLCFFCIMNDPDPFVRRTQTSHFFQQMPLTDDQDHVLVLSGLRNIAIAQPDDPEFPSLGIFTSMAQLIQKGIHHKQWLLKDQNIYIPYYAAHIIGTYATNNPQSAQKAAESGVVPALVELLRGKISWVEQRVAARALCHLASHDRAFQALAETEKIVELAIEIASDCLGTVYRQFLAMGERKRLKYHCELLTRGLGGLETENRKAEEWGVQLQEWCLYLLTCFASKGSRRFLDLICEEPGFLNELCVMRGGIESCKDSPGGLGLIRELCNSEIGRGKISNLREVVANLVDVARSSDYWQEKAIESVVLLLKDPGIRNRVIGVCAAAMADLVDHAVGETITQALLQDYHMIKYGGMRLECQEAEKALEETWELKVERKKKEKVMKTEELKQRESMAGLLKREGNENFWSGEIEKAVSKYSKALEVCPLKLKKERIVLYSNRAQSYLALEEAELAIGDATRALCLSGGSRPHRKSLWRRAQAFDMKGSARESLMDGWRFVEAGRKKKKKDIQIPCFAARLVKKQMDATCPFAGVMTSSDVGRA